MRRRGTTVAELLVVIGLVAVLLGLLLPAVQAVRASTWRTSCQNNLRQVGLAMQHHWSSQGRLPAGRGAPLPTIFSAHAYLLPFLEAETVGQAINFQLPPTTFTVAANTFDGSANTTAANGLVSVFLCPAEIRSRVPGLAFAGTSYAANVGSGNFQFGTLTEADGVFFLDSRLPGAALVDGTAATAAFSERRFGDGIGAAPDGPATSPLRMREIAGATDTTIPACNATSAGWFGERGGKWILGNYGNTLYNHSLSPNAADFDCMNMAQQKARSSARSYHEGGVQVLFCDGSVHFVGDTIDHTVWQTLATREGGETLAHEW